MDRIARDVVSALLDAEDRCAYCNSPLLYDEPNDEFVEPVYETEEGTLICQDCYTGQMDYKYEMMEEQQNEAKSEEYNT